MGSSSLGQMSSSRTLQPWAPVQDLTVVQALSVLTLTTVLKKLGTEFACVCHIDSSTPQHGLQTNPAAGGAGDTVSLSSPDCADSVCIVASINSPLVLTGRCRG